MEIFDALSIINKKLDRVLEKLGDKPKETSVNPPIKPTTTNINLSTNLSRYVTINEFIRSDYAIRNRLPNSMAEKQWNNAKILCQDFIDPIRDFYGKPVIVSSGYRSPSVNSGVGGATSSEHVNGNAIDFHVKDVPLKTVFNDIFSGRIKFKGNYDQLIYEFGSWIHIGRRDIPRKQNFTTFTEKGKNTQYRVVKSPL